MPALDFKKKFVPQILDGSKTHTIRGPRKHPIKRGDWLALYTGRRTKYVSKLGEATCTDVKDINIGCADHSVRFMRAFDVKKILSSDEILALALSDGFKDADEFFAFFARSKHTDDAGIFNGDIYYWGNTFKPVAS